MCVDDHPLIREGLARTLGREADMEVVGAAATGEEAVEMYRRLRPDVVLMDLQLPGMSGLRTIEEIRREDSDARIIVLTMYQGDEDIHRALRAGAATYLFKDTLSYDLVTFVREVHAGRRPLPKPVSSRVSSRASQTALSPRELEVLSLIVAGKQNKEIADALGLGVETVGTHIKHLFTKLGVNDRVTAVTVAVTRGIVHLP